LKVWTGTQTFPFVQPKLRTSTTYDPINAIEVEDKGISEVRFNGSLVNEFMFLLYCDPQAESIKNPLLAPGLSITVITYAKYVIITQNIHPYWGVSKMFVWVQLLPWLTQTFRMSEPLFFEWPMVRIVK
jgi:hypothetical protein